MSNILQIHTPTREKEYFYGIDLENKGKFDGRIYAGPLPGRCKTFTPKESDNVEALVKTLNMGYIGNNPFKIDKTSQGWLYIYRYK